MIILMDTPGGLLDSTHAMVKDFYESRVPIVVYVMPQGARAASAGAILTLAANIAAMSPSTNIGAAHPVSSTGGQPDAVMAKKIENDTAAFVRSIAKRRNRPIDWADQVVRKSVSVTDTEALDAFQLCTRLEGIIPALEPSHALAHVGKIAGALPSDHLLLMNLCGRGDKDIFAVAERLGFDI